MCFDQLARNALTNEGVDVWFPTWYAEYEAAVTKLAELESVDLVQVLADHLEANQDQWNPPEHETGFEYFGDEPEWRTENI
jgi:hypothetical protein